MVAEEALVLLRLLLSTRLQMYPLTCRTLGNLVAGDLIVACRLLLCIDASCSPSSASLVAGCPAVGSYSTFPTLVFCILHCAAPDDRIDCFLGCSRGSRACLRIVARFYPGRPWE